MKRVPSIAPRRLTAASGSKANTSSSGTSNCSPGSVEAELDATRSVSFAGLDENRSCSSVSTPLEETALGCVLRRLKNDRFIRCSRLSILPQPIQARDVPWGVHLRTGRIARRVNERKHRGRFVLISGHPSFHRMKLLVPRCRAEDFLQRGDSLTCLHDANHA